MLSGFTPRQDLQSPSPEVFFKLETRAPRRIFRSEVFQFSTQEGYPRIEQAAVARLAVRASQAQSQTESPYCRDCTGDVPTISSGIRSKSAACAYFSSAHEILHTRLRRVERPLCDAIKVVVCLSTNTVPYILTYSLPGDGSWGLNQRGGRSDFRFAADCCGHCFQERPCCCQVAPTKIRAF